MIDETVRTNAVEAFFVVSPSLLPLKYTSMLAMDVVVVAVVVDAARIH